MDNSPTTLTTWLSAAKMHDTITTTMTMRTMTLIIGIKLWACYFFFFFVIINLLVSAREFRFFFLKLITLLVLSAFLTKNRDHYFTKFLNYKWFCYDGDVLKLVGEMLGRQVVNRICMISRYFVAKYQMSRAQSLNYRKYVG